MQTEDFGGICSFIDLHFWSSRPVVRISLFLSRIKNFMTLITVIYRRLRNFTADNRYLRLNPTF